MKVRDAMTDEVLTITPGRTLREAARFLSDHNIGAAVIIDPEQPGPGIITERDLVRSLDHGATFSDAIQVSPDEHDVANLARMASDQNYLYVTYIQAPGSEGGSTPRESA